MARLPFALWSLFARFRTECRQCPYCKSLQHDRIQRKKLLIEARRCRQCDLVFRWPADTAFKAKEFYERDYVGNSTTLPTDSEMNALKESGFKGSRYDKVDYLKLVRELVLPPSRVLDFGSSWGFFTFQLRQTGYRAEGFDLSQRRASFGQSQLGIPLSSVWDDLRKTGFPRFDLVFSAHTLEHVSDLKQTLERLSEALVVGGHLLLIVPNGDGEEARKYGVHWGPFIGESHTVAYSASWFSKNLPNHGFRILDLFSPVAQGKDPQCNGRELVCMARRD